LEQSSRGRQITTGAAKKIGQHAKLSLWNHCVRILLIFFVLLWIAGCSTLFHPPVLSDDSNLENIQYQLLRNFSQLKTLRGWAKIIVESEDVSFQANAYILLSNPDSLLIKVEAFLGIDVGTFFMDRDSFKVYIPFQNSFMTGSIDSLTASPVIPIEIGHQKLVQTMTGLELLQDIEQAKVSKQEKKFIVTGMNSPYQFEYWIDMNKGIVKGCQVTDSEDELFLIEKFDRISNINGVRIPRTIYFQYPQKKQSLTLFYNELIVNQKIKSKEFEIKMPKSVIKIKRS
jgi:hypothetical protein